MFSADSTLRQNRRGSAYISLDVGLSAALHRQNYPRSLGCLFRLTPVSHKPFSLVRRTPEDPDFGDKNGLCETGVRPILFRRVCSRHSSFDSLATSPPASGSLQLLKKTNCNKYSLRLGTRVSTSRQHVEQVCNYSEIRDRSRVNEPTRRNDCDSKSKPSTQPTTPTANRQRQRPPGMSRSLPRISSESRV